MQIRNTSSANVIKLQKKEIRKCVASVSHSLELK